MPVPDLIVIFRAKQSRKETGSQWPTQEQMLLFCVFPAKSLILSPQDAGEVAFIPIWPESITGKGRKERGTTDWGDNPTQAEQVSSSSPASSAHAAGLPGEVAGHDAELPVEQHPALRGEAEGLDILYPTTLYCVILDVYLCIRI